MFLWKMFYVAGDKISIFDAHGYFIKYYIIFIRKIFLISAIAHGVESKIGKNGNKVFDEFRSKIKFCA